MTVQIPRHLLTGALAVAVFYGLLGTEVQCTTAEARPSLSDLQAQIDELADDFDVLAAEADTAPIVIDGTGDVLGRTLVAGNESALVQFDLPDLPLFVLTVEKDEILANGVATWFESTDCTGQAWVDGGDATRGVTAYVVSEVLDGARTFYVADPLDPPQMISRRSSNANGRGCEPDTTEGAANPVTPVDLDGMFTPPFRVTTRERIQAQP